MKARLQIRHVVVAAAFLVLLAAFLVRYVLVLAGCLPNAAARRPMPEPVPNGASWRELEARAREATDVADDFIRENSLLRIPFSEANMYFRRWAGMRYFPEEGILVLENEYLTGPRARIDVGHAAGKLVDLHAFCRARGISFLHVVAPHKADPQNPRFPRGMADFANDNADRLLTRLADNDVPVLDLRACARAAGVTNIYDLFFRGDHHWKPEVGLQAAVQIAAELERRENFRLPLGLLATGNFHFKRYPKWFLGSYGKKTTRAFAPIEDFLLITPNFKTDLTLAVPADNIERRGTFRDVLIQKRQLAERRFYGRNPYAAYLYHDRPVVTVVNHRRPEGPRLVVIKDSFANVVIPFLALAVGRIDAIDVRHFTGSIRPWLEENRPDAVVVLYTAGSMHKKFFRFD